MEKCLSFPLAVLTRRLIQPPEKNRTEAKKEGPISLTPFVVRLTGSCQLRVLGAVCLFVLAVAAPGLSAQSTLDLASGVHSAVPLPSSSITPDAPPFGGANVVVTSAGGPQNETTIAVDPNNPSNLIGGANDYRNGDAQCGRYTSSNNGRTWTDLATFGLFTPAGSTRAFTAAGDPGVAFDANGHAYYLCMYFTRTPGTITPNMSISRMMAARHGARLFRCRHLQPKRTLMTRATSPSITPALRLTAGTCTWRGPA